MSDDRPSSPIHSGSSSPDVHQNNNHATTSISNNNGSGAGDVANNNVVYRRERPSRACTARSAARLHAAAAAEAAVVAAVRKQKPSRKERHFPLPVEEEEEIPPSPPHPFSKVVTSLVGEPPPSQLPRWSIRSMWELASILNFLNVFRPLLNIKVEFTVEEFETALITHNNTLADIHIPLLKAIPPVARMALGQNTWVTVLCRKLRQWWHWVAEGDLPIVASHGAEVEAYNMLDPGIRVVILKALCDIRVEQEDIRNYIDDSIKHGVPPSAFRKERTGGDSFGISYWYEDDPNIGQRLYREIRKVEVKKGKGKGKSVPPISNSCYEWETVATNLDEFQDVSEKLSLSKNRTEASLGKKLKIDMLPEIEKVHTRREKQLKKQHRQALLLDSMMNVDGLGAGRSLRGRKPVSYTFDDYDRSINEAIKITKRKPPSPEPTSRSNVIKYENGRVDDTSQVPQNFSFNVHSPDSPDYDGTDEDLKSDQLDRSNRRRQRPQRYSAREFVEAVSENEADFDSDDDIVGEAVYDEEYLRKRKERRKVSSSSEGDEEYHVDGENSEEEEEEEEEEGDDSSSASDESDKPRRFKKLAMPGCTRRGTNLRSVDELQSGLRRSKRSNRTRIDYKKCEFSDSEPESTKPEKSNGSEKQSDASASASASDTAGFSMGSEDSDEGGNKDNMDTEDKMDTGDNLDDEDNLDTENKMDTGDNLDDEDNLVTEEMKTDQPVVIEQPGARKEEQIQPPTKVNSPDQDEFEGRSQKRRFLDLNELAPGSGFDDGPMMKDDTDDF